VRYIGVLPCRGCAGERWDLELSLGGPARYVLRRSWLDANRGAISGERMRGSWKLVGHAGIGAAWSAYRLQPDGDGAALSLLRLDEDRLQPRNPGAGTIDAVLQRIPVVVDDGGVDVVAADARAPVQLHPGQVLRVHLRDSPATGYRWELQPQLPPSLQLEADPGQLPPAGGHAEHTRTWSFRAQAPDLTHLRFDNRRTLDDGSGGGDESIDFDLHVH